MTRVPPRLGSSSAQLRDDRYGRSPQNAFPARKCRISDGSEAVRAPRLIYRARAVESELPGAASVIPGAHPLSWVAGRLSTLRRLGQSRPPALVASSANRSVVSVRRPEGSHQIAVNPVDPDRISGDRARIFPPGWKHRAMDRTVTLRASPAVVSRTDRLASSSVATTSQNPRRASPTTRATEGRPTSLLRWEPSWEPFSVDWCGRLWTPVESRAFVSGLCGLLWTAVDAACRSTDQKVGDSSSPGRANESVVPQGILAYSGSVTF
jgi:hypothetical protein